MVSTLKIYEILEDAKIEDKHARAITMAIERAIDDSLEQNNKAQALVLATKGDVALLKEDLFKVREELVKLVSDTKAEIIKWMFIFWIGQLAAFVAFLKLFVH
ncbi:MAG TPA: hypothetical protein VEO95_13030 [Chthoniobacteraceae bacterium]|nr:hypothetical protein [Chthoniobacteraceae bacterium]